MITCFGYFSMIKQILNVNWYMNLKAKESFNSKTFFSFRRGSVMYVKIIINYISAFCSGPQPEVGDKNHP